MTRLDSSLFEDMPPAAYKILIQSVLGTEDDAIADYNMIEFYEAIESFYDSRNDAESLLLPFFAERYASMYPRLKRLMRGYAMKVGERNAKAEIVSTILSQTTHYADFINNINALNALAHEYASQSADVSVQLAIAPFKEMVTDSIHLFSASDTPGYAKAKIKAARESAIAIVKMGVPMLMQWADRNDMRFELRSPLAFAGPKLHDLLTHNFDLPNPNQYLTTNMIMSWETAEALDPALAYPLTRDNFKRWLRMNGLAAMIGRYGEEAGSDYVLTARDMPPILFSEHHRTLPVYLNRRDTPFLDDVVNRVHYVPADYITSLNVNPELPFEYPGESTQTRIMCDCMALVAFAFTVVIANVEMGRGHHKPRWVHSDLNPINIHHMKHLAPVILHRMRESLDA